MSTITATNLHGDTIRKTGGSLGVDIRIKNTSVYESDGGTSVTQNLVQGVCKSWVNFDGSESPLTNRDSFNVSSLYDNGTGNYDQVFTNNMSSANYSVTGTVADNIPISSNRDTTFQCVAESTSQINLNLFSNSQNDRNHVCGQAFGDLA